MDKRRMDKLGIETSLLGFGCMRFPLDETGEIDERLSEEMIGYGIANGVNYIDTAYYYHEGKSEPFVGKVMEKYDRSSYLLATKLPVWVLKGQEQAQEIFSDQLQKLRTEYIDFYLLHSLDKDSWKLVLKYELIPMLERLRAEGKIRYIGFSFHDDFEVFEEIINYYPWDFCQIQLNYMDTEEQAGEKGCQLAEKLGIPVVVMEPVRGGALANFAEDMNEKFYALDKEASIASYALRFVASYPNVKVILSGMSAMEQVKDNVATFSPFRPLNDAEAQTVGEIRETLKARMQNGCTGCRYCVPCPHGVDIPGNFKIWNTYHMYQKFQPVRLAWGNMSRKHKANNCVQCGACEEKCPQKIKISQDMPRVWTDMEGKVWR